MEITTKQIDHYHAKSKIDIGTATYNFWASAEGHDPQTNRLMIGEERDDLSRQDIFVIRGDRQMIVDLIDELTRQLDGLNMFYNDIRLREMEND